MQRITRDGQPPSRYATIQPQPQRVPRQPVSSVSRCARGCAVGATTLAPEIDRWYGSRAWPWSASAPRGTQHITRPGHPSSRCCAIQRATTRASRGREQRREPCTWVRTRRCHACTRVSPMAGQSGGAMERLHAAWHTAHHSSWPYIIALLRHPTSHTRRVRREAVSSVLRRARG